MTKKINALYLFGLWAIRKEDKKVEIFNPQLDYINYAIFKQSEDNMHLINGYPALMRFDAPLYQLVAEFSYNKFFRE